MARTSDTADYMVTQCQACGMLNVIPREYPDGRVCADCSGGHPGGQIAYTMGIVEYMDGTVDRVYPEYIRFLDTEDFAGDCNE